MDYKRGHANLTPAAVHLVKLGRSAALLMAVNIDKIVRGLFEKGVPKAGSGAVQTLFWSDPDRQSFITCVILVFYSSNLPELKEVGSGGLVMQETCKSHLRKTG